MIGEMVIAYTVFSLLFVARWVFNAIACGVLKIAVIVSIFGVHIGFVVDDWTSNETERGINVGVRKNVVVTRACKRKISETRTWAPKSVSISILLVVVEWDVTYSCGVMMFVEDITDADLVCVGRCEQRKRAFERFGFFYLQ